MTTQWHLVPPGPGEWKAEVMDGGKLPVGSEVEKGS